MAKSRPDPIVAALRLSLRRRPRSGSDTLPEFEPLRLLLDSTGTIIELTYPDLVLGRHSEADIRLPLPEVSRRHCQFLFSAGRWHLHNLQSLNGIYVNGQPVEHAELQTGDRLKIGGFSFTVESAADMPLEGPQGVLRRLVRDLPPPTSNSHLRRRDESAEPVYRFALAELE